MVSCLSKVKKKETFFVGFVVRLIVMATSFGIVPFPPLVELRNSPEFLPLIEQGSHQLASLASMSSLAWLVSRADF